MIDMITLKRIMISIGGVLSVLFGLFHLSFWILFDWKNELLKIRMENSNIMQMLNIGSSIILLSFGYILLFNRNEVINTKIGETILIILSIFYFARLIMEFVFPGGSVLFGFILFFCVLIYLIPAIIKTSN